MSSRPSAIDSAATLQDTETGSYDLPAYPASTFSAATTMGDGTVTNITDMTIVTNNTTVTDTRSPRQSTSYAMLWAEAPPESEPTRAEPTTRDQCISTNTFLVVGVCATGAVTLGGVAYVIGRGIQQHLNVPTGPF